MPRATDVSPNDLQSLADAPKTSREYETIYILRPGTTNEGVAEVNQRVRGIIENMGGKVLKVDNWGKRRLAYPINDLMEGYYVLMTMDAKPEFPAELDRVFKITEGVMRSLITDVEL